MTYIVYYYIVYYSSNILYHNFKIITRILGNNYFCSAIYKVKWKIFKIFFIKDILFKKYLIFELLFNEKLLFLTQRSLHNFILMNKIKNFNLILNKKLIYKKILRIFNFNLYMLNKNNCSTALSYKWIILFIKLIWNDEKSV